MTLFGKITAIKSLALSKITHLSIVLPRFSAKLIKDLEGLLFRFIWDNKPDKVKRTTSVMPQKMGGGGISRALSWLMSEKIGKKLATTNIVLSD